MRHLHLGYCHCCQATKYSGFHRNRVACDDSNEIEICSPRNEGSKLAFLTASQLILLLANSRMRIIIFFLQLLLHKKWKVVLLIEVVFTVELDLSEGVVVLYFHLPLPTLMSAMVIGVEAAAPLLFNTIVRLSITAMDLGMCFQLGKGFMEIW